MLPSVSGCCARTSLRIPQWMIIVNISPSFTFYQMYPNVQIPWFYTLQEYASMWFTALQSILMSSGQSFFTSRCIHLWGPSNRVFVDGVEPQQVQVRQLWAGPKWSKHLDADCKKNGRKIAHFHHFPSMCKIRTEPFKAVLVHRLHLTEQGLGTQQKLWRSTQEVWKVESTGCCHNLRPVHCRGLRSQRKGR